MNRCSNSNESLWRERSSILAILVYYFVGSFGTVWVQKKDFSIFFSLLGQLGVCLRALKSGMQSSTQDQDVKVSLIENVEASLTTDVFLSEVFSCSHKSYYLKKISQKRTLFSKDCKFCPSSR